jgi:hypothetical protein
VLSKVVNHRVLFYLNKIPIIRCITLAQTWLITHGHLAIAGLLSVSKYITKESYADGNSKINKNDISRIKLNKLYPYSKLKKPREYGGKPEDNEIIKSIESIISRIRQGEFQWRLTLPNEYIKDITGLDNYYRFNVQTLQPLLINLILDLKKEVLLSI